MMLANLVFPLPTYLLAFVDATFKTLGMLSISTSQPSLDLMFPQELISSEVSQQLPPELTVCTCFNQR